MTTLIKKSYLPCKIGGGCFSSESSVCVEDYQGKQVSGFFDNSMIKNGMLEVEVLKEGSSLLVIIPAYGHEFLEHRDITVKKEALRYV